MLGQHWSKSASCPGPSLTDRQRSVVDGLVLGGASDNTKGNSHSVRPALIASSTQIRFLEWVHDELDPFFTGKSTRANNMEGFEGGPFDTVYSLVSVSSDVFRDSLDQKVTLDPLSVAIWYARKGRNVYADYGNRPMKWAAISLSKVDEPYGLWQDKLAEATGVDWNLERGTRTWELKIYRKGIDEFFEWMDGPLPGYEWKWDRRTKSEYDSKSASSSRLFDSQ